MKIVSISHHVTGEITYCDASGLVRRFENAIQLGNAFAYQAGQLEHTQASLAATIDRLQKLIKDVRRAETIEAARQIVDTCDGVPF